MRFRWPWRRSRHLLITPEMAKAISASMQGLFSITSEQAETFRRMQDEVWADMRAGKVSEWDWSPEPLTRWERFKLFPRTLWYRIFKPVPRVEGHWCGTFDVGKTVVVKPPPRYRDEDAR